MSASGDGQGRPRQRGTSLRARLRSDRGDEGIGVLEILVAFVVFMICFIPLLQMIPTGSGIIVYSADQRLATAVANTTLQSAQNTTTPGTDYTTVPTWATAPRTATQQGGVTFEIYTVGGWCATSTTPGNGLVTAADQPSYHVVVKVGWGQYGTAESTDHVVVDSTELSTVTNAPATGVTVTSCPLALT
jgi:Tfp pilus assembly protein PilV